MYFVIEKSKTGTYQWAIKQTTGRLMACGLPGFRTKAKALANFKQTTEVLIKYEQDNKKADAQ